MVCFFRILTLNTIESIESFNFDCHQISSASRMDCDAFFMDPARTIDSVIAMYSPLVSKTLSFVSFLVPGCSDLTRNLLILHVAMFEKR